MLTVIYESISRLVRSWWRHDRIRISPDDGRILRIEPQDVLVIGGDQVEVIARSVVERVVGFSLSFKCRTATGGAKLCVDLDQDGQLLSLNWKADNNDQVLLPEEVEVWPRGRTI